VPAPGHSPEPLTAAFPPGGAPYTEHTDVRVAGFPAGELLAADAPRTAPRRGVAKIGVVTAAAIIVVIGGTAGAIAMTGGSGDTNTTAADASPPSAVDLRNAEAERQKLSAQRATRAARRDFARRPALAPKGTPLPGDAGNPVPAGEAQKIAKELLPKYGFNPDTQFGCLVELWDHESHWRVNAGSPNGPYGIPQANPGSKMASAGPDWLNDATTQIKWGLGYIKNRYDGPCGAWTSFQSKGWY
jgi:hypothetical protein